MKVTILGSGTSTGVPMVGCTCRVCTSPDGRDVRTRSSLLVRHQDRTILVDTSTDLRGQSLREHLTRIDAVFFTHTHADHVNGIDDLRSFHFMHRDVIPCFGARETIDTLRNRFPYIFDVKEGSGYTPLLFPTAVSEPFELFGLRVVPIPLEHGRTATLGYRFGNCAYLTDCSAIPSLSAPLLQDLALLIIDGLRWREHPTHFNIETAIAASAQLKPRRTILTHLSHDVLYAEGDSLPDGFEFAYDGLACEVE